MTKQPKPPAEHADNGFEELGKELAKATKRSAFSIWLSRGENYARLTEQIESHGVHWDTIAAWAVRQGHTNGHPLTAMAAKKAYERETARLEKIREKAASKRKPQAKAATINPPVRVVEEPKPERDKGEEADLDSLAASLNAGRGWLPKGNKRR